MNPPTQSEAISEGIRIPCDNMDLRGNLDIPERCAGMVLFAHGSGSSRLSPRNKFVAGVLRDAGFATLLMDLLSSKEERMQRTRFDIDLLAHRLDAALAWLHADARMAGLPVGLFGASTGAAAAIRVAAMPEANIAAVVSRGGRPDLAGHDVLAAVTAPTLLIVGGNDTGVIALNESAQGYLRCESRMEIVPGATHLFEEPGALEDVARLARDWFQSHLAASTSRGPLAPSTHTGISAP